MQQESDTYQLATASPNTITTWQSRTTTGARTDTEARAGTCAGGRAGGAVSTRAGTGATSGSPYNTEAGGGAGRSPVPLPVSRAGTGDRSSGCQDTGASTGTGVGADTGTRVGIGPSRSSGRRKPFTKQCKPQQSSFICLSLKLGCIVTAFISTTYSVLGVTRAGISFASLVDDKEETSKVYLMSFLILSIISHGVTFVLSIFLLVGVLMCSFEPRSVVSGSTRVCVYGVPRSVSRAAAVNPRATVSVMHSGDPAVCTPSPHTVSAPRERSLLPGLAILAPPRVYALCLGTGGTALFTALARTAEVPSKRLNDQGVFFFNVAARSAKVSFQRIIDWRSFLLLDYSFYRRPEGEGDLQHPCFTDIQ
ncbi:hypothetical protein EVAR_81205_1 [Eumeta japonica]|uniref:Uncharacterized protein n=1 Tax=Eumeta variegata TaxID=151549 RepID=A0A4C1V0U7_EUMVA|nr:hypothetical protein EVAR_81205_1 [Eumeta japonica]